MKKPVMTHIFNTLLILVVSAALSIAAAQDEEAPDKRSKEAETLFEQAKKEIDTGNIAGAYSTLRKLIDEYGNTQYFREKRLEVRLELDWVVKKIANEEFSKAALTALVEDYPAGYLLRIPKDWITIPPAAKKAGQADDPRYRGIKEKKVRLYATQRVGIISDISENIYMQFFVVYGANSLGAVSETADTYIRRNLAGLSLKGEEKIASEGPQILKRVYEGERPLGQMNARNDDGVYEPRDISYHKTVLAYFVYMGGAEKKSFAILSSWEGMETSARLLSVITERILGTLRPLSDSERVGFEGRIVTPGWKSLKSRYYKIFYSCGKKKAAEVAKHLDAITKVYMKILPLNGQKVNCAVRLFNSSREYSVYSGAPAGAPAYYNAEKDEIVAYNYFGSGFEDTGEGSQEVTYNIIYHEAFHNYLAKIYNESDRKQLRIPPWFSEGLGDYFYGIEFNDALRKIKKVNVHMERLSRIGRAISENTYIPLSNLFRYSQNDYYKNAAICYAQGWSICYFLMEYRGPRADKYRKFLNTLCDLLRTENNGAIASRDALRQAGIDCATMEHDWKGFIMGIYREYFGEKEPHS